MGDEYQLRKDIDRLYGLVWDNEENTYKLLPKEYFDKLVEGLDEYPPSLQVMYYTKQEIGELFYGKVEADDLLDDKQDKLVSGTNIKTINNSSILGDGNIEISGGSTIDIATSWGSTLSDEKVPSEKLTKNSLNNKQDKLTSGTNIKTINSQSLLGSGDITISVEPTNIATSWGSTLSDSKVPSEKLTKNTLDTKISTSNTTGLVKNDGTIDTTSYLTSSDITGKEDTSNKVNTWSSATTTKYPNALLVKNGLDAKAPTDHKSTETTYGRASTTYYGHVKASTDVPSTDSTNGSVGTSNGIYANANHRHPKSSIYAPSSHTHSISNVTNLQSSLDGKSSTSHKHDDWYVIDPLTNYVIYANPDTGLAILYFSKSITLSSSYSNFKTEETLSDFTYYPLKTTYTSTADPNTVARLDTSGNIQIKTTRTSGEYAVNCTFVYPY